MDAKRMAHVGFAQKKQQKKKKQIFGSMLVVVVFARFLSSSLCAPRALSQTNKLQELPTKVEKEKLRELAQLDSRYNLARATYVGVFLLFRSMPVRSSFTT